MNTPPGHPPDYISIPEHLRLQPITGVRDRRVERLLQEARIRVYGDLDGRRLSEFEKYRGCGERGVWGLRDLVLRALYPGAEPDLKTWPIPMAWYDPEPTISVPAVVRDLRLNDLPVSMRLELVLAGLGMETLGELHGFPIRRLLARRNCGRKTLQELQSLLRRAEAGEFTRFQCLPPSSAPAQLLHLIDGLTRQLPERDRCLLTAFGEAPGEALPTPGQIARARGLADSAVQYHLAHGLNCIWRQGRPGLRILLGRLEQLLAETRTQLSPSLVATWQDPARPFRHSPQFYIRLIARLQAEVRGRPAEPAFAVSAAAWGLRFDDLPVSTGLKSILEAAGLERLGQLHGVSIRWFWFRPNCGPKRLAELQTLLRRAEAGEFASSKQGPTPPAAACLRSKFST